MQEKIAHIAQGELHVYSILAIAGLLIYLGEEVFTRQPVDGLGYDFSPENTVVNEERIAPHEVIRKGGSREKADAIHPEPSAQVEDHENARSRYVLDLKSRLMISIDHAL